MTKRRKRQLDLVFAAMAGIVSTMLAHSHYFASIKLGGTKPEGAAVIDYEKTQDAVRVSQSSTPSQLAPTRQYTKPQ